MEHFMTTDLTQAVSKSNEGHWWRWTHGKSGTTASSSPVGSLYDSNNHTKSSSKNQTTAAGAATSSSYWQKRTIRTPKDVNNSVASSSSPTWSTSLDARSSSSFSPKFFPATASSSSCSSRATAGFCKKKTSMLSHSSRGHRDGLGSKGSVGMSSASSVFVFSTREDKCAAPSEISWSKSKRSTPRKDRRNSKNSLSMLSNSRTGTRAVATRNTNFLSNEDSEMKVLEPSLNMFAFSTQDSKPSRSSARGNSRFASSRTKKADHVFAAETTVFAFDEKLSRFNPSTFPVSSPSAATTASATHPLSSQPLSTIDPVVSCARAVLQECIRSRKIEQKTARKRPIEGCFDGDLWENYGFGCQYESISKPGEYRVMSPGSCSSSDDELRQLSSVNPSFCKLAKEEIYRQILVGDNDLSSSPEFQCFSPLIEEKGIPIEIRYQLPLALGTANETSKECTICQLRYGIGDHIVTLPCQHFFHACCVDKWLWNHTSCPLCRTEVTLDQEAEARNTKHNFTECSPMDRERIRRQMRFSSQHADFRPVVPVESDQLELEVSRMAIDEDSEIEDEPSYIVCPTPHFATSAQDD
ncbi:unnamed protein product [Peronospora destructor]|uniref:RING-type domain-containing protein n=1 Tax=Peronospora destructor TaxID=86335 RepID=A0AAV0TIQ2_9STRA|nr:unnamed protein product [Peronospora destructor]